MLQPGSMEPEYAVGDILITREKDPSTIKIGDNIVYLGNKADYKGKIITHNVIEIEQDEQGKYLFHTKGIANTVEDPVVHEDQLYGIVIQNNIVLAWLCKIVSNRYGLYFCVMVPLILYMFIGFVRSQEEKIEQEREERERKRQRKEKINKDKDILEESDINSEEKTIKTKSKKTTTTKNKEDVEKAQADNKKENAKTSNDSEKVKRTTKTARTKKTKEE